MSEEETPLKCLSIVPEDIGEYHITIKVYEHRMEFICYECHGIDCSEERHGSLMYAKKEDDNDLCYDIKDAQSFISGFLKWDGCINVKFDEQGQFSLHFCGQYETDKISPLFARIFQLGKEHIPSWDH